MEMNFEGHVYVRTRQLNQAALKDATDFELFAPTDMAKGSDPSASSQDQCFEQLILFIHQDKHYCECFEM